jgi:hypothetical protein
VCVLSTVIQTIVARDKKLNRGFFIARRSGTGKCPLLCATFRTNKNNFYVLGVIWLNHAKSSTKKQFSSEDFT